MKDKVSISYVKLKEISIYKEILAICKAFSRPHIDYGDIIFDQRSNDSFCEKIGSA